MNNVTPLQLNKSHLKPGQQFDPSSHECGLTSESFKALCNAGVAYFEGRMIKNRAGSLKG